MLAFVFLIGLANFALGVALAIYLKRWPDIDLFLSDPNLYAMTRQAKKYAWAACGIKIQDPDELHLPPVENTDDDSLISGFGNRDALLLTSGMSEDDKQVINMIQETDLITEQLIDNMLSMLKADSDRQRQRTLDIEYRIQQKMAGKNEELLKDVLHDFQTTNQTWASHLTLFAEKLYDSLDSLGERKELAKKLNDLMFDKVSQINAILRQPRQLEVDEERSTCQYLLSDICCLAENSHVFRDHLMKWTATATKQENETPAVEGEIETAEPAGMLDRFEFRVVIENWRAGANKATPTAPIAILDLDRFGFTNARYGVGNGDLLLTQVANLLREQMKKSAIPFRLARLSGQAFGMFMPTQTLADAQTFVEKIRQMFEATTFVLADCECTLTMSCGLIEVDETATAEEALKRARKMVQAAKKAGRDRTAVEVGEAVQTVKPLSATSKSLVVKVNSDAESSRLAAIRRDPSQPLAAPNGNLAPQAAEPAFQSAG